MSHAGGSEATARYETLFERYFIHQQQYQLAYLRPYFSVPLIDYRYLHQVGCLLFNKVQRMPR